jgi:hypothetical protein
MNEVTGSQVHTDIHMSLIDAQKLREALIKAEYKALAKSKVTFLG